MIRQCFVAVTALVVALCACGVDFHIGNGDGTKPTTRSGLAQQTASSAARIADLGEFAASLQRWTRGIGGLAPDLGNISGGNGSLALSGAVHRPVIGPLHADFPCPQDLSDAVPSDFICFVEGKQIGTGDILETRWTVVVYAPGGDLDAIVVIDGWADRDYADGATSHISVTDLEAPNGTTAADLGRHWVEVREVRVYPSSSPHELDDRALVANFRGTSDDQSSAERARVADQPDIYRSARLVQRFRDGREIAIEAWPSEPVTADTEIQAGAVTRVSTYPSGPLQRSEETLAFDRATQTARGRRDYEYADGTTEQENLSLEGPNVDVTRIGRNGIQETAHVDREKQIFEHQILYPGGHPLRQTREEGTFVNDDATGTLHIELTQTVEFAGGATMHTVAVLDIQGNGRIDLSYTRTHPDASQESGDLTLVLGPLSTTISGRIELANGHPLDVDGVIYGDGYAELHLEYDDPGTDVRPDAVADLVRYPDGSGNATVTSEAGTTAVHFDGLGGITVEATIPAESN